MTTLEGMKQKWARKMGVAGAKWKKGVEGKQGAFESGIQGVIGRPTTKGPAWSAGVGAVSSSEFQSSVSGKEEKMARKYVEAMTS